MRLNLVILEEELREKFTCVERGTVRDSRLHLSGAGLLARTELDSRLVYVAEARRLPVRWKSEKPVSLIVVGQVEPEYFENSPTEYLCVQEKHFALVFNAVSEIFRKYRTLDEALKEHLLEWAAPEECCGCISRFLGVPFLVFDSFLRLLYCSEDAKDLLDWEQDAYSGRLLLPTEFVNQLELVYPCSRESEGGAVLLRDDRLPCHVLTTFFERRAYTVLAFETGKKLTPQMAVLLDYLSPYVEKAFIREMREQTGQRGLAALIVSLLKGEKLPGEELRNRLGTVGWKPEDDYCFMVLQSRMESRTLADVNTICLKVENQFASCIAFPYEGRIAVLINLSRSDCRMYEVSRRVVLLLRDGLMQAGLSFKFWDFETVPVYYCQACQACQLGKLYDPDKWCYSFVEYALQHLLHYGSSMIPPRHLCHPSLVALYDYDQKNGTELLKTLETYISCNCNAVTAAGELYIHRNTFYQRLGRIQELERLNLEDSEERLYLQMSVKLISMYYYELEHGSPLPSEFVSFKQDTLSWPCMSLSREGKEP